MKIREYYLEAFPTDELGIEINENATFAGLFKELVYDGDVYLYIGVTDSLVRERCFEKIAQKLQVSYDYIYNLWLK
jgi:hypothetical protein